MKVIEIMRELADMPPDAAIVFELEMEYKETDSVAHLREDGRVGIRISPNRPQ